ncbi:hypothetical protein C1645_837306, partial [Glomus cerebriforme]
LLNIPATENAISVEVPAQETPSSLSTSPLEVFIAQDSLTGEIYKVYEVGIRIRVRIEKEMDRDGNKNRKEKEIGMGTFPLEVFTAQDSPTGSRFHIVFSHLGEIYKVYEEW